MSDYQEYKVERIGKNRFRITPPDPPSDGPLTVIGIILITGFIYVIQTATDFIQNNLDIILMLWIPIWLLISYLSTKKTDIWSTFKWKLWIAIFFFYILFVISLYLFYRHLYDDFSEIIFLGIKLIVPIVLTIMMSMDRYDETIRGISRLNGLFSLQWFLGGLLYFPDNAGLLIDCMTYGLIILITSIPFRIARRILKKKAQ